MVEVGVAITDLELRMTIKTLAAKGQSQRAIARQLDLCEGTVRYHLRRLAAPASSVTWTHRGWSTPSSSRSAPNLLRSSARSMLTGLVPSTLTPVWCSCIASIVFR